jgi:hypothetical protein
MTDIVCQAPGCTKPARQGGCCYAHYQRRRRYGDFDTVKKLPFGAQNWLREHVSESGNDCLIWPFARNSQGYGVVELNGRQTSLQHAMCTLAYGAAPTPKHQAAHSCGNGHLGCGNPNHLRWATATENAADTLIHGTRARGERQGSSKLSENAVREIRSLAGRTKQRDIAVAFGVSQGQVNRIVQRRQWAWVA